MITTEQVLLQQLEEETRKMRELQNIFFRNKNGYNLTMARNSEGKVDDILTRLSNMRRGSL